MLFATCSGEAANGISCKENFDQLVSPSIEVIGRSWSISRITSKYGIKSVPCIESGVMSTIMVFRVKYGCMKNSGVPGFMSRRLLLIRCRMKFRFSLYCVMSLILLSCITTFLSDLAWVRWIK